MIFPSDPKLSMILLKLLQQTATKIAWGLKHVIQGESLKTEFVEPEEEKVKPYCFLQLFNGKV